MVYGTFPVYFRAEFNRDSYHGNYQSMRPFYGDFRRGVYKFNQKVGLNQVITCKGIKFSVMCDPQGFGLPPKQGKHYMDYMERAYIVLFNTAKLMGYLQSLRMSIREY